MTDANRCPFRKIVGVALMVICGLVYPASAQNVEQKLPLVVAGEMPLYPIMARAARVQGVVKIKVTTDGKEVTSVDAESGPPMLARFAKENILSWKFSKHKPTTFVTTFEYVLEEPALCMYSNGKSILNLPLEVHISAKVVKTCDPAAKIKPHP